MTRQINSQIKHAFSQTPATAGQLRIGILKDDNVSIFSVRLSMRSAFPKARISEVPAHISPSEYARYLKDLDILVLPGVAKETCLYHAPLMAAKDVVAKAIYDDGLGVLGICAGKYNLYENIVYRASNGTLKEQAGLGFIMGSGIGPVDRDFAPEQPTQSRFDGTRMIKVIYNTMSGKTIETGVCYGDGPMGLLANNDTDVKVIARYSELEGRPAAIVEKKMGKGLIIATGVLPEIALAHMVLDEGQAHLFPAITSLRAAMAPFEVGRQIIMSDIVYRFNIHRYLASRAPTMVSVPT